MGGGTKQLFTPRNTLSSRQDKIQERRRGFEDEGMRKEKREGDKC